MEILYGRPKFFEVEIVRFPKGGSSQYDVVDWIRSHGRDAKLHDKDVRTFGTPADDGSFYGWSLMSLDNTWSKSQTALVGDYIIHYGKDDFRVYPPWDFDRLYEITGSLENG